MRRRTSALVLSIAPTDTEGTFYVASDGIVGPPGLRDRHRFKTKGRARRGYRIEETTRFIETGRTTVDRVELIEISEQQLDSSLFDIPSDYRPALPLVRGGYDLTRRDTLRNRLQVYWEELKLTTRAIFR